MKKEASELKDWIAGYRAAFDDLEVVSEERIWNRIQRGSKKTEKLGWRLQVGSHWRWSAAAGIALLLGFFLAFPNVDSRDQPFNLADYYPELAMEEQRYQRLIGEKEKALGLDRIKQDDFKTIFEELTLLDEIHAEIRRDLPQYYGNEHLVGTLIKYYEHKIRILERLTLELEKHKEYEKRNRETRL